MHVLIKRFGKAMVALCMTLALTGCGGGGGSAPAPTTALNVGTNGGATATLGGSGHGNGGAPVGTATCLQCHGSILASNNFVSGEAVDNNGLSDYNNTSPTFFESFAGASVGGNWLVGVHGQPMGPQCEDCHGNGSQHFGVGPIPHYAPNIVSCEACHAQTSPIPGLSFFDQNAFNATAHANPAGRPDAFFNQGTNGTAQATLYSVNFPAGIYGPGVPETDLNGNPVSKNQNIQECSACHSEDQKPVHIAEGDLFSPPQVACASCHDPHRPADLDGTRNVVAFFSRADGPEVDPWQNLNYKPKRVNNTAGLSQFGAANLASGIWIRPRDHYEFFAGNDPANTFQGYNNYLADNALAGTTAPAGAAPPTTGLNLDRLRLSPERECAACHTQGAYEFAGTPTHNQDVYSQWLNSAHGDIYASVFPGGWYAFSLADWSINSSGKISLSGERPGYPYDMGGQVGQGGYLASSSSNGTFDPTMPDNGASPPIPNFIGGVTSYVVNGVKPSTAPAIGSGPTQAFDGRPTNWQTGKGLVGANEAYCYRCHQGIGAIDYQRGTAWSTATGDFVSGDPVTGKDAHILWGDASATCVTCHEPHQNGTNTNMSQNVRQPRVLSYNTEFTAGGLAGLINLSSSVNLKTADVARGAAPSNDGTLKMEDLSDAPTRILGNNIVCLECHQGRDSGWTVWNKMRRWVKYGANGATAIANPALPAHTLAADPQSESVAEDFAYAVAPGDTVPGNSVIPDLWMGINTGGQSQTVPWSAVDPHHFPGGGLLYGVNGFEFFNPAATTQLSYSSGIPAHQTGANGHTTGCVGCHMDTDNNVTATNKLGGHTWQMFDPTSAFNAKTGEFASENVAKCQECHGASVTGFHSVPMPPDQDWADNGILNDTVYNNIGTLTDLAARWGPVWNGHVGGASNVPPQYGTGNGGTGLLGRLNEALWDQGIYWNV
ncbi:MAG TPA: hypothetical protein VGO93_22670, partial [Candidatus Xenobia bacterium]